MANEDQVCMYFDASMMGYLIQGTNAYCKCLQLCLFDSIYEIIFFEFELAFACFFYMMIERFLISTSWFSRGCLIASVRTQ